MEVIGTGFGLGVGDGMKNGVLVLSMDSKLLMQNKGICLFLLDVPSGLQMPW